MGTRSFDSTPYATSYANVQLAVSVACMGALCFGYHLGVLNGPLSAIATELGFAGQPLLEGMVRITPGAFMSKFDLLHRPPLVA